MKLIYMIAADVLRALGWEVEINEKDSYWNLVLTNTTSSEDMPQSHKSCLRGLLRGWLMEFNFEGGRQQVNIYKELHGLDPEDDRYSCLDTCVKRTDSNTPESELNDREVFVRRKDRFDRYVLAEPVSENITTGLSTEQEAATRATINNRNKTIDDSIIDLLPNAEKKELKKQDIIEIPFGARDSELQEEIYYIPKGFHAEIEGNKVVIKQGEQKPTWSEVDEWKFSDIMALLRGGENCHYNTPELFEWLKSLKDRVQPKQE